MNSSTHDLPVTLSICIPTYNRARYLENLLKDLSATVTALKYPIEILIGDNASDDETALVAKCYTQILPIKYFRRPKNLGALHNLSLLYEAASGAYCVYLADDDFLIIEQVREIIEFLELNPQVGVVQAPWLNHDRVTGQNFDQFYHLDQKVVIEHQDFRGLLSLLLGKHIFPEIYLCRTSLIKSIYKSPADHAYWAFVQASVMLNNTSICFWDKPFYKFVLRYWADLPHNHLGHEETKTGWDRYRGGLEYILSYFSHQLSSDERRLWLNEIERFTMDRMAVALRLRAHDRKGWIESYYIANRLLAAGRGNALPLSYDQYRLNAALEYLVDFRSHAPETSALAYLSSKPPRLLTQASHFLSISWVVVDHIDQLPDFSIFLTEENSGNHPRAISTISESRLLNMFP